MGEDLFLKVVTDIFRGGGGAALNYQSYFRNRGL
jgi:hypothetical protein